MSRTPQRLTETGSDASPCGPAEPAFDHATLEIIMNQHRHLLAVVAVAAASLLSAGTVFAQEATPDTWLQAAQATKSRADVAAELAAARQSGLTKSWSAGYMEPLRSQALRAEVKARTARAIQSGELKAINAEVYSFTPAAAQTLAAR